MSDIKRSAKTRFKKHTSVKQDAINFGTFSLNVDNARLSRQGSTIALTPKAFALLHCLLRHAGQLLTKDQLFEIVWPTVVVSDAALTVSIREIRQALNDTTSNPQYIETVHKKGYRFIASINSAEDSGDGSITKQLVGRTKAREKLASAVIKAADGNRQLVFITGEAGVGKTSVIEEFIKTETHSTLWMGTGHCIEQHGTSEPYLPILEAISRLFQQNQKTLIDLMIRYAPSWLTQFPALVREKVTANTLHVAMANPQSMMRELADFLEAITELSPLILCLEDLHWCDHSTADFISFLIRRKYPARLLIFVTVRPGSTTNETSHFRNVKQNLIVSGLGSQVNLQSLSREDVAECLSSQFSPNSFPAFFAGAIHRLSDGNPLFMTNILQGLQDAKMIEKLKDVWHLNIGIQQLDKFVPYSLQDMVVNQVECLPAELKRVLEAASVAGEPNGLAMQFTLSEVAAALSVKPSSLEEHISQLVEQRHFLKFEGTVEFSDGTMCSEYAFTHGLYQKVIYQHGRMSTKQTQHKKIAEYLEDTFTDKTRDLTIKLAVHFELGRDFVQSANYLCQSSIFANGLGGSREAVSLLRSALVLLKKVKPGLAKDRSELTTQLLLAPSLIAALGNASLEVEQTYQRALQLSISLDDKNERFPALFGLRSFYLTTGRFDEALTLAQELLTLAEDLEDEGKKLEAHVGLASVQFYLGDIQQSHAHALAGIELYDPQKHAAHALTYGLDPGVFCYARAGQTAWALGCSDEALELVRKGVGYAESSNHPYSVVFALHNLTLLYLYRREGQAALENAIKADLLASHHDFTFLVAWGYHLKAWAYSMTNDSKQGLQEIDKALNASNLEASTTKSYLNLFLAECYWHLADWQRGLRLLEQPIMVGAFEAERLRLMAEFYNMKRLTMPTLEQRAAEFDTTESFYRQAIALSETQQANAYLLQSALGLATLLTKQQCHREAYSCLNEAYEKSQDGADRLDIYEAEQLLSKLSGYLSV